ncbi:unnamed protein product [Heterobilharzia americana]|nr:unnamed protein product [Heterobilharzia americana]
MYYFVGWPTVLGSYCATDEFISLCSTKSGEYFVVCTATDLVLFHIKFICAIAHFTRSHKCLSENGPTSSAVWKEDSSKLLLSTKNGAVLIYSIENLQHVYEMFSESIANSPKEVFSLESVVKVAECMCNAFFLGDIVVISSENGDLIRMKWDGSYFGKSLTVKSISFIPDINSFADHGHSESQIYCRNIELASTFGGAFALFSSGYVALLMLSSCLADQSVIEGILLENATHSTCIAVNNRFRSLAVGTKSIQALAAAYLCHSTFHKQECTLTLLRASIQAFKWDLIRDLLRFIYAIDPTEFNSSENQKVKQQLDKSQMLLLSSRNQISCLSTAEKNDIQSEVLSEYYINESIGYDEISKFPTPSSPPTLLDIESDAQCYLNRASHLVTNIPEIFVDGSYFGQANVLALWLMKNASYLKPVLTWPKAFLNLMEDFDVFGHTLECSKKNPSSFTLKEKSILQSNNVSQAANAILTSEDSTYNLDSSEFLSQLQLFLKEKNDISIGSPNFNVFVKRGIIPNTHVEQVTEINSPAASNASDTDSFQYSKLQREISNCSFAEPSKAVEKVSFHLNYPSTFDTMFHLEHNKVDQSLLLNSSSRSRRDYLDKFVSPTPVMLNSDNLNEKHWTSIDHFLPSGSSAALSITDSNEHLFNGTTEDSSFQSETSEKWTCSIT